MSIRVTVRAGEAIRVQAGEDTATALAAREGAEAAREAAALHEAAAEALTGPTYASSAAGLAATVEGNGFAVASGGGLVSIFRKISGAAVVQRVLATSAALALATGAGLVGYALPVSGAISQTIATILGERGVSVTAFGADRTGVSDSLSAIEAARDHAIATGKVLVFPHGDYLVSAPVDLSAARLHVRGYGRVVIYAGFDGGNVISCDAGDSTITYQGSIRNITVCGNGSANQTGFFFRNRIHGVYKDLRVRNVTKYAFHIAGDVFATYSNLVSDVQNEGADGEAVPIRDLHIEGSSAISLTTSCTFKDCIFENGTEAGVYLAGGSNNVFKGGGAEGLDGWGVIILSASYRNHFEQFYCEYNGAGDFRVDGDHNHFLNCEAYDLARVTAQWKIRTGARGNTIDRCGGRTGVERYATIEIDAGAEDTIVRDCELYRLIDNGTDTLAENYSDQYNNKTRAMTRLNCKGFINAANDTAAGLAGVPVGFAYRDGNNMKVRIA